MMVLSVFRLVYLPFLDLRTDIYRPLMLYSTLKNKIQGVYNY